MSRCEKTILGLLVTKSFLVFFWGALLAGDLPVCEKPKVNHPLQHLWYW